MLEFFVLVFVSVFLAVNAFGALPVFIAMLQKYRKADRLAVIEKSFIIAFVVFLLFSVFGKYIFGLMRIEIYSFYIAGGILLAIISIGMLTGKRPGTKISENEVKMLKHAHKEELENLAITPIAVPMLTGPGSITLGLMLFSSIEFNGLDSALMAGEFVLGASLAYLISFVVLAKSHYLEKLIGRIGLKVMSRIMGLLLLSIGVQFIVNGVLQIVASV